YPAALLSRICKRRLFRIGGVQPLVVARYIACRTTPCPLSRDAALGTKLRCLLASPRFAVHATPTLDASSVLFVPDRRVGIAQKLKKTGSDACPRLASV